MKQMFTKRWRRRPRSAKIRKRSAGKRRRTNHAGTETTTVSAREDIDHEVAREIENGATDTESGRDRVTGGDMMRGTIGGGIDQEAASTSDETSVQSVEESAMHMTTIRGHDRGSGGAGEAPGAGRHMRGAKGGETEDFLSQ
jgi:hypothetical protein